MALLACETFSCVGESVESKAMISYVELGSQTKSVKVRDEG